MRAGNFISPDPSDASATLVRVKAVPGASRDAVAGVLGDRLKIRVSAPPQDGRANDAICTLLAGVLGVPARSVQLLSGQSQAQKTLRVAGLSPSEVLAKLGL